MGLLGAHDGAVTSVVYDVTSQSAVSGSEDGTPKVWSTASMRRVASLPDTNGRVVNIRGADFQKRLVVGSLSDGCILLWDLRNTSHSIASLQGHAASVTKAHVDFDTMRVVSCSLDNTVKVWDLKESICLGTLVGHTAPVSSLVVSGW